MLHNIPLSDAAGQRRDRQGRHTDRTVVERYLQWLATRRKQRTMKLRNLYLESFCTSADDESVPFCDLRINEVRSFIDALHAALNGVAGPKRGFLLKLPPSTCFFTPFRPANGQCECSLRRRRHREPPASDHGGNRYEDRLPET
jgi:hypothetical protein